MQNSLSKFIKKNEKCNERKRENNLTPFQKEINLKLFKSNLFLMYFRLILSRRKRYQTKKENALKKMLRQC